VPGELMHAEMHEQPQVLARLAERFPADGAAVRGVRPAGLAGTGFVARGSSDNAAVLGRYLVELTSGRPAALVAPSLVTRYSARVDWRAWLAVALSQSGETPEVVSVAVAMRSSGAVVIGVSNERESRLGEVVDLHLPSDAGTEVAVPATKTVTAQMMAMFLIAGALADPDRAESSVSWSAADLGQVEREVTATLADTAAVTAGAARWADADRLWVVGRGLLYSAVLETALKIKETTGILAEGMSAADLLHGPIAAIRPGAPVVVFDDGGPTSGDIRQLLPRLLERDADVFVISTGEQADAGLLGPPGWPLHVIAATVRGQQIAYALALARGLDPDSPQGLSKVTPTH